MWVKNSEGKRDAIFTMLCVSFIVLCANILFGSVELIKFGSFSLSPRFIDAGVIAAFWGPLLAAYVARRGTTKYFETKEQDPEDI